MVNLHIDPAFDDAERRRRLFGGDVLVYTHVPEVAAFAALHPGDDHRAVRSPRPALDPDGALPRAARRHAHRVQAPLDPRPALHGPRPRHRARAGLRAREDPRRRAQAAHRLPAGRALHRHRLRLPGPPRHLVRRTEGPAQLVDAGVAGGREQHHGVLPARVRRPGGEQLRRLRLLPRQHLAREHQGLQRGHGRPRAPGAGARRPGRRDAPDRGPTAGRDHAVLR